MIIEIKYGPFESQYHRDLVNEEFKDHVKTFIDGVLSPQLGEHPRLIKGTVEARFNEEKHGGLNSAIRNDFRFSLKFTSKSGESDYEAELKYVHPSFEARRGSSFYLWTPKRKKKREEQVHKIEMVIIKVEEGKKVDERCPVCGSELICGNGKDMLSVHCSKNCFDYHYHKDPETGAFAHGGTLFMKEPTT